MRMKEIVRIVHRGRIIMVAQTVAAAIVRQIKAHLYSSTQAHIGESSWSLIQISL